MHIDCGRDLIDVYRSLSHWSPALLLDVGAAVGSISRKMRRFAPGSNVIAFEPNPANWGHFERQHGNDPNVALVKAAVGDAPGTVRFAGGTKIQATNARWAEFAGGSSIGRVEENGDLEVPTVTIDDVLGDREALFCKIDVQGYEPKVLAGAQRAISDRRIKMLLVEFMQYPGIFPLLEGYYCFSQEWTLIPYINPDAPTPDMSNWDVGPPRQLSTGRLSHRGWPKALPTDSDEFTQFQRSQNAKIGRCWTDLLFIAPDHLEDFLAVARPPQAAGDAVPRYLPSGAVMGRASSQR